VWLIGDILRVIKAAASAEGLAIGLLAAADTCGLICQSGEKKNSLASRSSASSARFVSDIRPPLIGPPSQHAWSRENA